MILALFQSIAYQSLGLCDKPGKVSRDIWHLSNIVW